MYLQDVLFKENNSIIYYIRHNKTHVAILKLIEFWEETLNPNLFKFTYNMNLLKIIDEIERKISLYQELINEQKHKIEKHTLLEYFKDKFSFIFDEYDLDDNKSIYQRSRTKSVINRMEQYKYNMTQNNFNDEEEINEGNIYFEENKQTHEKKLKSITIDLLIKKIALNDNIIFKTPNDLKNIITQISYSYTAIISSDIFINKILTAYNYFFTKYKSNSPSISSPPTGLIMLLNSVINITYNENCKILSSDIINTLINFYSGLSPEADYNLQNETYNSYLLIKQIKDKEYDIPSILYIHSNSNTFEPFYILKYSNNELAQELSRLSYILLQKINYQEILRYSLLKGDNKKTLAPYYIKMIERFNKISNFVIEDIISYNDINLQAKVYEKYSELMETLINQNNYFDSYSIIIALQNIAFQNMSKLQSKINKKYKNKINYCYETYFNPSSKLFNAMKNCMNNKLVFIPFLGIFSNFIEKSKEFSKYIINGYLINIKKINNTFTNFETFFYFKKIQCNYTDNQNLIIFSYINPLEKDELEKVIYNIENNIYIQKSNTDIKVLTKSDIYLKNSLYNSKF